MVQVLSELSDSKGRGKLEFQTLAVQFCIWLSNYVKRLSLVSVKTNLFTKL